MTLQKTCKIFFLAGAVTMQCSLVAMTDWPTPREAYGAGAKIKTEEPWPTLQKRIMELGFFTKVKESFVCVVNSKKD